MVDKNGTEIHIGDWISYSPYINEDRIFIAKIIKQSTGDKTSKVNIHQDDVILADNEFVGYRWLAAKNVKKMTNEDLLLWELEN